MSKAVSMCVDPSPEAVQAWAKRVHDVQTKQMTPEQRRALSERIESSRMQEVSRRQCKAVKSHACRSRALAAEGLRQMSHSDAAGSAEAYARWKGAQASSEKHQDVALRRLEMSKAAPSMASAGAAAMVLREAEESDEEALEEVAQLVQVEDRSALNMIAQAPAAPAGGAAPGSADAAVEALLEEMRVEPEDAQACAAKFGLYEGYAEQVQKMRETLFKFHADSAPTVPPAVAQGMDRQLKAIDRHEAMAIYDDAREWFVFQMMRQAEKNNRGMASILEDFEKKLDFLAKSDQSECPVCLDNFEADGPHAAETLGCCHKVCKECWAQWTAVMSGNAFCPLCKHADFMEHIGRRVA